MSSDPTQDILVRRAELYARPVDQGTQKAVTDVVVVRADASSLFALDAATVMQVIPTRGLCRLPAGGAGLVALTVVGGEAVPVADLAMLLGLGEAAHHRPFTVVLDGDDPVGLLVEEAIEVGPIHEDDVLPFPGDRDTVGRLQRGLAPDDVVMLDAQALLADHRLVVPRPSTQLLSGSSVPPHPGAS